MNSRGIPSGKSSEIVLHCSWELFKRIFFWEFLLKVLTNWSIRQEPSSNPLFIHCFSYFSKELCKNQVRFSDIRLVYSSRISLSNSLGQKFIIIFPKDFFRNYSETFFKSFCKKSPQIHSRNSPRCNLEISTGIPNGNSSRIFPKNC